MLVTIAAMTRQEMSMMWLCSWLQQQRLGKRCRTFSSPKAVFKTALGDEKVRHLLCRRCYIHDISHRPLCLCISVSLYMLCAYDHIRAMCDIYIWYMHASWYVLDAYVWCKYAIHTRMAWAWYTDMCSTYLADIVAALALLDSLPRMIAKT